MKAVIVCESMFGNTRELAEQVRAGLVETGIQAKLVDVGDVTSGDLTGLDLLVVAAPTHALTLSRPESRAEAVTRGAQPHQVTVGVREWLGQIVTYFPVDVPRPPVAVFDTRVAMARHWPGSAATRAARGFRRTGFRVIERVSFYVDAVPGPIADGELFRARAWGGRLHRLLETDGEPEDGAA